MITAIQSGVLEEPTAGAINPVDALLNLVSGAQLFRGTDGGFYCKPAAIGQHDLYEVRSPALRDWLVDAYYLERGQTPPGSAVSRVIAGLESRARTQGTLRQVFVRVGSEGTHRLPSILSGLRRCIRAGCRDSRLGMVGCRSTRRVVSTADRDDGAAVAASWREH